jgi:subfamily B ATP-binding cassette protein MsbA
MSISRRSPTPNGAARAFFNKLLARRAGIICKDNTAAQGRFDLAEHGLRESWSTLLRLYRRYLPYARDDRRLYLVNCIFIVSIAATNTLIIWLVSKPLNLLQQGNFDGIAPALAALAVIIIVNQLAHFGANTLTARLEVHLAGRMRNAMVVSCMASSVTLIDQHSEGDTLARLSNDLGQLTNFVVYSLFGLISHVCIFAFYGSMLFWIDSWLALLAMLCSPVFALHQRFFGRRKQRAASALLAHAGKLLDRETEILRNLRGINSFRVESRIAEKHRAAFERMGHFALHSKWLDAWIHGTLTALIYLGALAIVFLGIAQIRNGDIGIGDLVGFLFYLGYLSVPVQGTSQIALQGREAAAAGQRVNAILDRQSTVTERTDAAVLRVSQGHIELKDVSFAYGAGPTVLDRLNLSIGSGETVALVGPSGAGKSTLARMLMRFYDPNSGSIAIDGTDIRSVTLDSLRREIAVVWQEPFLLNDSVAANLRLANTHADPQELKQACQAAHAWEFIERLPMGLETIIGTGGVELSTGQRQRLSIAQAFLRNARILILDEATSALDSETEKLIAQAMDRLCQDKTTLIIAHRFSAIRRAHRVVFFNGDGSITVGTHDDLWHTHARYREAVEWQTTGH